MLELEVRNVIDKSVLCWLATTDASQTPNVSPKEVFTYWGDDRLIIANIASPGSVRNIRANPSVCVSFIDVLVQKGFKVKGKAAIVRSGQEGYQAIQAELEKLTGGKYPFSEVIVIRVESIEAIVAPSYKLFPELSEEERIEQAKRQYGLK
ncbi:pyridoxamine 5'-phosphate oxidase family protein [Roseivirga seohaensis]|uniref:pyridoxamine 5'-phosphate oxidase family protein n=1 Tax=Roseivirga seohaensis TaxID=1914963 RepID=UPI003BAA71FF